MDETAYRTVAALNNPSPCVFGRAIQTGGVQCELAEKHALAEREIVACTSPTARINCATLAALIYERATFALRLPRPGEPLPHATTMQLHCGGLLALQQAVAMSIPDVHGMIRKVHDDGRGLNDLHWGDIVAGVVAWQPRKFRPRRTRSTDRQFP